jgi:hypothetical protein
MPQKVALTIAGMADLHHMSYDCVGSTDRHGSPCAALLLLPRVSCHRPKRRPRPHAPLSSLLV